MKLCNRYNTERQLNLVNNPIRILKKKHSTHLNSKHSFLPTRFNNTYYCCIKRENIQMNGNCYEKGKG